MLMASFGIDLYDDEAGTLQISESKLADFFAWLKYAVDQGALPGDLTDWSWDEVHQAFRGEDSFMKFHGIWNVPPQQEAMNLPDAETYFHKIGWLNSPPAEKGGRSANLSHPIVYAVNPDSEHKDLAALLVAIAIQSYFNTEHAVTTAHTSIHYSQAAMPAYQQAWYLAAATPMLARATFLPNHPDIALFNAIIFKGIQSVETGRLDPKEAAAFVIDELDADLGGTVAILD
jgi:inositol-phosphate transport system substrate-binding protein